MKLDIEFEQETDGRWIAEVPALPGVLVYGDDQADAQHKVVALALRVLADRIDHGEAVPVDLAELFEMHGGAAA